MRNIRSIHHRMVACKTATLGTVLLSVSMAHVTAQTADNVTNPSASVPAVSYRSVFKETSLGVEKNTENWRKANDEVGKFTRGHLDILKWEEQESAKAMKSSTDKPMEQPVADPDALKKPAVAAPAGTTAPKPEATKPVAAPAHKH